MCLATLLALLSLTTVSAAPPNPPPEGPASITLLTPDPALGVSVVFAVTAPKQTGKKYDVRVQVLCYSDVDAALVYGEAGPWDQAFLLGGGSSDWRNTRPSESVQCVATEYYWSYHGVQRFNWLAETEFAAAGQ